MTMIEKGTQPTIKENNIISSAKKVIYQISENIPKTEAKLVSTGKS